MYNPPLIFQWYIQSFFLQYKYICIFCCYTLNNLKNIQTSRKSTREQERDTELNIQIEAMNMYEVGSKELKVVWAHWVKYICKYYIHVCNHNQRITLIPSFKYHTHLQVHIMCKHISQFQRTCLYSIFISLYNYLYLCNK